MILQMRYAAPRTIVNGLARAHVAFVANKLREPTFLRGTLHVAVPLRVPFVRVRSHPWLRRTVQRSCPFHDLLAILTIIQTSFRNYIGGMLYGAIHIGGQSCCCHRSRPRHWTRDRITARKRRRFRRRQ